MSICLFKQQQQREKQEDSFKYTACSIRVSEVGEKAFCLPGLRYCWIDRNFTVVDSKFDKTILKKKKEIEQCIFDSAYCHY
jgi:hypothetical protein